MRQAGGERDPSNRSTSSSRIKACNQQCVKQHTAPPLATIDELVTVAFGHRPVKGTISFSLNNAAFDEAVLRASHETQISQVVSLF